MKYIELKNLARKAFPCKIFQRKTFPARSCKEKITLQDLARKKFPYKILQGTNFLARSCKEQISLQDLTSNCIFTRILQDPCKERIFPQPGHQSSFTVHVRSLVRTVLFWLCSNQMIIQLSAQLNMCAPKR